MPVVQIDMIEGRTTEQKRKMVKGITEVLVKTINCKPESVMIIIRNAKTEDLAGSGTLVLDQK